MTEVSTIGLDLAKSVFQVHGTDDEGKVVVRRQLRRRQVLSFFKKLPPCLVGLRPVRHRTIGRARSRPLGTMQGRGAQVWRYLKDGKWKTNKYTGEMKDGKAHGRGVWVPITGRLLINNFAAEQEAARRGLGLAILPRLNLRDDLEAGRLVAVLPGYEVDRGVLSLVRPATPFEPPKLRAFIDFITVALRARARPDPGIVPTA